MAAIINIAGYKFVALPDPKSLRSRLLPLCKDWNLKGTILLSTEGINLFVAGPPENVNLLLAELRSRPGLADLEIKASESVEQPFRRMLVRIKKEIIAFGVEGIDPSKKTSPKLPPRTLKQWLDEGRPVTLLDTRNDYEIKLGTFKGALPIGIDQFRDFPAAARKLPDSLKEKPIITFCTGGIRCEKAGPFLEREGFKNVFQLEGGILKYFEECGGAHYQGECFVFDQRVGVDACLHETEFTQCYICQIPLTPEEQRDSRYSPGASCPYCHKSTAEQAALNLARRHEAIHRAVNPLPGSEPYDNYRPISVPEECDGLTLIEFLGRIINPAPASDWEELGRNGRLLNQNREPVPTSHRVHAGERYLHKLPAMVEPDINGNITILHEDQALIVLEKPAPLPMHPCGRYNRNTLQYILNQVYYPEKPRPAHRLDANTSGVLLLARTRHFASKLQPQFDRGEVKKIYLARVQGHPKQDVFCCDAPISVEPGAVGTRVVDLEKGLPASTEFRTLQRNQDGTSLLEARPVTGRTNQIRIHLWQLGLPVCGDPVYLPGKQLGEIQTIRIEDPPLCLHAWRIAFQHPLTRHSIEFTAQAPAWSKQ